jgi:hypothetical protein
MGNFASKLLPDGLKYHAPAPEAPTPKDVFTVRLYLLMKVPAELANIILEEARYWPKVSCRSTAESAYRFVGATSEKPDASACCLLSPRLNEWLITNGALSAKVKAVRFTIVSHDQGWASEDDFPGGSDLFWPCNVVLIERVRIQDDTKDHGHGLKQPLFEISEELSLNKNGAIWMAEFNRLWKLEEKMRTPG